MIPGSRTGDVQQVTFVVVDLFEVGVVRDGLDPLLEGHDFIVAGHHRQGPDLTRATVAASFREGVNIPRRFTLHVPLTLTPPSCLRVNLTISRTHKTVRSVFHAHAVDIHHLITAHGFRILWHAP